MEFEELKRVWDKQNEKPMYTIDHNTLQSISSKKKKSAIKKARLMELVLIGANLVAGSTLLISHTVKGSNNTFAFLMGIVMVLTALVILYYRSRRLSNLPTYEQTIYGDVEHGLSEAKYVVRLSRIMQYYYFMIGIFMVLAKGFDDWAQTVMVIGFIGFTLYASTWEHKWYVRKYNDLRGLKKTLESDRD